MSLKFRHIFFWSDPNKENVSQSPLYGRLRKVTTLIYEQEMSRAQSRWQNNGYRSSSLAEMPWIIRVAETLCMELRLTQGSRIRTKLDEVMNNFSNWSLLFFYLRRISFYQINNLHMLFIIKIVLYDWWVYVLLAIYSSLDTLIHRFILAIFGILKASAGYSMPFLFAMKPHSEMYKNVWHALLHEKNCSFFCDSKVPKPKVSLLPYY